MTDNQNPTDPQDPTAPSEETQGEAVSTEEVAAGATADALESVVATEGQVDAGADGVPAEGAGDAAADGVPGDAADGVPVEGDVGALLEVDDVVVGDDAIDDDTMRRALEAILMVTDEPLPALTLARTVGRAVGDVAAALNGLSEEYTEQRRGFDLREVGGGWRYYTREDTAQYVERFVLDGQQARLTQAALETLAVVAYKQPVSRARVSAIRGVNVDGVMRTLITRGLVEEAGADTESQATLYRTSSYFLERMGMQSLDDLPELAPYLPDMDDMEEELAAQAAPPAAEDPEGPLENDLAPPPASAEAETDEGDDVAESAVADDAAGGAEHAGVDEIPQGEEDEAADGDPTGDAAGEAVEVGAVADGGSGGVGAGGDVASGDDGGVGGSGRGDDEDESGTRG